MKKNRMEEKEKKHFSSFLIVAGFSFKSPWIFKSLFRAVLGVPIPAGVFILVCELLPTGAGLGVPWQPLGEERSLDVLGGAPGDEGRQEDVMREGPVCSRYAGNCWNTNASMRSPFSLVSSLAPKIFSV